ncbi:MAG: FAD-binding oxidoreductase [Gammaproteobacteria bacterium]|nr:FAD-binding oxidoreductase [Gammaproteobacteria bacterium]
MDPFRQYLDKKEKLISEYASGKVAFRLHKTTMTNLFRYGGNDARDRSGLRVDEFNQVIGIDPETATIDVEGMTTIETVLQATLRHNLLPKISPELKHITIGGAIVGIGIESSCFLHGFLHDSLIQAEVLLPGGETVICTADNEYADLFHALPNSFGTLGYVLRATLSLMHATQYVRLTNSNHENVSHYLESFEAHMDQPEGVFLEGLFYNRKELYLTSGKFIENARNPVNIYRGDPFYLKSRTATQLDMNTDDYIFRFDPDWFWNVPDHGVYNIFRQLSPRRFRNSSFYTHYTRLKRGLCDLLGIRNPTEEELIQDWVIPWHRAEEFIDFILDNIDIQGQPWVALPIVPKTRATLYPLLPSRSGSAIHEYRLLLFCRQTRSATGLPLHPDSGPTVF